jgi:hypothetical protein
VTQDGYELGMFCWWGEDQHVWDGHGLKDPCFLLELFFESQTIEKNLFYEGEIGLLKR